MKIDRNGSGTLRGRRAGGSTSGRAKIRRFAAEPVARGAICGIAARAHDKTRNT